MYRLALIANREQDFDTAWKLHRQALEADPRLAARITPAGSPHHPSSAGPTMRRKTWTAARCAIASNKHP